GIIAGVAVSAFRRQANRWRRCGPCDGAGDLVGPDAGVDRQHSRNDGRLAARISLGGGAAQLRGDALRDCALAERAVKIKDLSQNSRSSGPERRRDGGSMACGFADLWRWDGVVSRKTYALVGLGGFAIKSLIDRTVGAY